MSQEIESIWHQPFLDRYSRTWESRKVESLKCSTDIWYMVEFGQQFPKLKLLKLFALDITEWNASAEPGEIGGGGYLLLLERVPFLFITSSNTAADQLKILLRISLKTQRTRLRKSTLNLGMSCW